MGKYLDAAVVGIAVGGPYSLMGISLTLMFRTTGVLSFAHAGFAMIAGFTYGELAGARAWPALVAGLVAVLLSVGAALLTERLAMRPIARTGPAVKLIATLGVLSVITGLITQFFGGQPDETPLVFPSGVMRIGGAAITYQQLGILAITIATALGLRAFLQRSRFGIAIRAVQVNAEAAELLGVPITRVDQFNWALAGLLSGVVGVLLTPLIAATVATYPLVLVKALAGTLFGGLLSLPLTFAGGVAVGVIESAARVGFSVRGAPEVAVMFTVAILLLVRRSWGDDDNATAVASSGSTVGPVRFRINQQLDRVPWVGGSTRSILLVGMALLIVAGSFVAAGDEYWGSVGAVSLFYAIEVISMVVLTGWGGQVSLMHGAYVGIGTFVTGWLVGVQDVPLELAIPMAGLVGVALGAILGLPALRLNGVQFAIASTVFAAAATAWLFELPDLPRNMNRGTLFGIDLFESSNVYLIMLVVTALMLAVAAALRRSTWWRLLIAARDVPDAVRHAGLRPGPIRIVAFSVASFMATVGGCFYGIIATSYSPFNFSLLLSFSLLLYAVVGGLESLLGPVVAAMAFGLLPQVLQQEAGASSSAWPIVVSGVAVIALLVLRPSGVASMLRPRGLSEGHLDFGRFDAVVSTGWQHEDDTSPASNPSPTLAPKS
ncbi:MAG: ABC transporter permease [Acidimicrobiales bacterium]|nr:ABC transporter permease [Acidimicrobiales bacterium]